MEGFTGWPAEFADRYRAKGYWQGRLLGSILTDGAAKWPDRVALVDGDRKWTYRQLAAWAGQVASGLHTRGIGRGDRVLVHLPNFAEFVALVFGLFRVGAVPVLALPPHRENEITHLADLSEAVAYVAPDVHGGFDHRPLARKLTGVEHVFIVGEPQEFTAFQELALEATVDTPEPEPGDVAVLLLSGGTTGLPKLIPRTHDDYHYNLRASAEAAGFDGETRYLAALPAAHNFAFACPGVLGTLWSGGTVVLTATADPETSFGLIEREKITATALVPPLVLVWLDTVEESHAELSSLRLVQAGGARLKDEAARRVRTGLGCVLQQVYGMAEGLLNYTGLDDPEELITGTQGRPLSPDDEVRVVDRDGNPVADGEAGELLVRGPYTIRGYYRAAEHNEKSFTEDGFYRSGDLVRRLPGGELVVEGRVKDVINRGGDKVPVEEVENLLLTHPGVHDVAIVGVPDDVMGERTCAFVIPKGTPPTRRDLVAHLTGLGVAAFKIPDKVRVVESFPRTGLGKVDRGALGQEIRS
ncbi:(2,3-dihydroxybenzoyl)adenylate synthase [Amycolatopsis regifaucium]|uniref:2,3-dihydroxybenzoate-AMP ligase n=1 Tax=Amycolatopsis regifaucium TaxID=546365 RepID=A0A154MHM1_9PSEU|nr:AMP-binding protein [Amycolatopsis regifaucium]KZB83931.1 2,3-dihydroxybenzoate-AMP ligase [Amycolatopsis regifaucium]OKA06628.1 2,3-dihydroxybenzoate-AMP ligase [Amycolatopsis regifaucium]SFH22136.1 2,3-dihydroxybenzoate-AMP ligase [Amycolatopsis regifaucium]